MCLIMGDNEIESVLLNQSAQMGDSQFFDIYKLNVEMADKTSERRLSANKFFLAINSSIIGFDAYFKSITDGNYFWVLNVAGLVISYMWQAYIKSSKQLNTSKFKIIHSIEKELPIRSFTAEWQILEEGKNRKTYKAFSDIEIYIPWVFFSIFCFLLAANIARYFFSDIPPISVTTQVQLLNVEGLDATTPSFYYT